MNSSPSTEDLGPFQLFVLVLSLFVLVLLGVDLVLPLDPETSRVIAWTDNAVCAVLFVDFVVRFRRAESKIAFLKWGWLDLLAVVPAIDAFRLGRVLRVFRVLRMIRALRSIHALLRLVFESPARGGVAAAAGVTFLVQAIASVVILAVEAGTESRIKTAEEAVWWSLTTMTTVGYGDYVPVTSAGRAVAGCLMIVGVGLFGTLSGAAASALLGRGAESPPAEPEPPDPAALHGEIAALRREIAELRGELAHRTPAPARAQATREGAPEEVA